MRLSDLKLRLESNVAERMSLVTHTVSYIDTMTVCCQGFSKDWVTELRKTGAGSVVPHWRKNPVFPLAIRIHQPTDRTLDHISKLKSYVIARFDISLDLMTGTRRDADGLNTFLTRHLTQRWRGQRRLTLYETTTYFGLPNARRNIAMYSDRLSKVAGGPCLHIDFRYLRTSSCKRIGIATVSDVRNFDPLPVLQRGYRISMLSPDSLHRQIEKMIGNSVREHNRQASGQTITRVEGKKIVNRFLCRAMQFRDEKPPVDPFQYPAQNWFDAVPDIARKAAVHLPVTLLIKEHTHVLSQ
jgi:hypothetical protein